jgi:membrane associated rhomboid family serine protease
MKLLDRLERKFRPYAISNLTMYLVFGQAATFLVTMAHPEILRELVLDRYDLARGEWWRLFTAIINPPSTNILFEVFALWIFYIMGNALERQWGEVRFNLYMIVGYLAMVAAAAVPDAVVTNVYWMGSVFLAFAMLYPDFEIMIYFILPVKVKWLALLMWIGYLVAFADGDWGTRATVGAGVANFVLFFHGDILQFFKNRKQRLKHTIAQAQDRDPYAPMHTCALCGVNDKVNPKMEFRYCPLCKGTPCYCIDHIHTHEHH